VPKSEPGSLAGSRLSLRMRRRLDVGIEAGMAGSHRKEHGEELPEVVQRYTVQAERLLVARAVDRLPGWRRDREHAPERLGRREQPLGQLEEHVLDLLSFISRVRVHVKEPAAGRAWMITSWQ
jgi:hypothetical protein